MNAQTLARWMATTAAALCCTAPALAQAPGEDPVVLTNKLSIQMQPTAKIAPSGSIDGVAGMPSWLRARVARYEAKSFSDDTSGILTDNDVVTTANAQGMKKTCVQEVGSNTLSSSTSNFNRYGPNQAPQIVVLRGDLVNICN